MEELGITLEELATMDVSDLERGLSSLLSLPPPLHMALWAHTHTHTHTNLQAHLHTFPYVRVCVHTLMHVEV